MYKSRTFQHPFCHFWMDLNEDEPHAPHMHELNPVQLYCSNVHTDLLHRFATKKIIQPFSFKMRRMNQGLKLTVLFGTRLIMWMFVGCQFLYM